MTESTPGRREFLAGACGILVAGFANLEFASPANAAGVTRLKNGKIQLRLPQVKELAAVGGVIAVRNSRGKSIAITRTGAKTYAAFDLTCPHEQIAVKPVAGESTWSCPGHGAQFDAKTGAVTGGPAKTGLAKVKTALKGNVLTVG